MKNIGDLIKKAQQVQVQMGAMQERIAQQVFSGAAGNGAVVVELTGKGDAKSVKLNESVVDKADIETLEDLLVVAFNNAKEQIELETNTQMQKIQADLGLPSNFKMPF